VEIEFTDKVKQQLQEWKKSGNKSLIQKVEALLQSISKDPYKGIGKPEELRYEWKSFWSRQITQEHRLVYRVIDEFTVRIYSIKGHYED